MLKTALLEGRPKGLLGAASLPLRLARRLFATGVTSTVRRGLAKASVAWHEWRLGLATESFIPWNEITDDACAVDYEPTTYSALQYGFDQIEIGPDDVIVDYGCGLGRVLAVAVRRGFRRAIGVELSPELCQSARSNLERSLGDAASRAEVVCANAAEWATPDDASVVFMFNPFRGRVLEEMLQRLHESLMRRPRELTVLYLQPVVDPNVLAKQPWLTLAKEETVEGVRFCIFHHQP